MTITSIRVADYITPNQVEFLEETSREEAIKRLISIAVKEGVLADEKEFFDAIIQREEMVSTGLGMGIAIPHAKIKQLDDFFLIVGIHRGEGIEWNAIDGLKVRLIFLIGGPQSLHKEYLQILSNLTQILKVEDNRQKFLNAKSQESVANIFHSC